MKIYSYKTKEPQDNKPNKKRKKLLKRLLTRKTFVWVFRIMAVGVFFVALLFLYYAKDLPDPNKLLERNVAESTKIFARDGSLLYEVHGETKRTLVDLNQISPYLKEATVAIEDKNFYKHGGISITGIARSAITDILTGSRGQGGSTITQQFVKNAMLTKDKSFDRKIREALLAIMIDARFSKDEILKLYLNEIPYGRNAYGIEAASQSYFGKSAKDLDLAESAYLAALPQAPSHFNPFGPYRDSLDARKDYVLQQMMEQGYISKEQKDQAQSEQVAFLQSSTGIKAPHFVFMVEDYLASKYGEESLQEGGLKVYTTLDPRLQDIAEQVVKEGAEKNASKYNAYNAALVAVDPKTGQILALVGSKDYFGEPEPAGCVPGKTCKFEPNVNAALSPLQPGSSFKPYVYATAFKKEFGYSPASMIIDVPTMFGVFGGKEYKPQNYSGTNYGPVSMRQALAGSLNVPAVKTLALVGVENAVQTAHDLGITSPLQNCGLSLVLGGCEVKLIDHVGGFAAIANMGLKHDETSILKIEDRNGKTLEEYKDDAKQVLDPQAAYELISIMTDNDARSYVFGSHSPLTLPGRVVAAKTGTTQNWHDGWTMGFTPSLAAGVWAGNNNGELLKKGADGVYVAAPIWNAFMSKALEGTPAEEFTVPPGIQHVVVDAVSGLLPTNATPSTKTEVFADYSVPKNSDNVHISVAIDSATGLPATSLTPPTNITYRVYTVFHSEKPDDPNWEAPVVAWAQSHGYNYPDAQLVNQDNSNLSGDGPSVGIVEPSDGATVSQLPLRVSVAAISQEPIVRVDLSIDGQFIQSLTSAPYIFTVGNNLSDGAHTIAVKAVDSSGRTSDTSITVNYSLNTPLTIVEPQASSKISFPVNLIAESGNSYGQVSFYYQPNNSANAKLIGQANNITRLGDKYQYVLNWVLGGLDKGTYQIYARTDTGIVTPKVKVIVQ